MSRGGMPIGGLLPPPTQPGPSGFDQATAGRSLMALPPGVQIPFVQFQPTTF
ncbi:MAG: hypothetical protein NTV57_12540 [Cyanobacteria bacterium]|nr:hypothetical protein [Cyanobacteriota bacterium]